MEYTDAQRLEKLRKEIFITGYDGGMAHLASCFSCVEILYTLYFRDILRYNLENPSDEDRDCFVLSKGHAGLALFTVLAEAGFITYDRLHSYLKPGSNVGGEPKRGDIPGIEATTGSLGHGLSMAVGMALAQKINGQGYKTYVLIGDGECQEGSIWEAAISAVKFGLENLVIVLDANRLQKTCTVEETMEYVHWEQKWKAFGWNVVETDGHDVDALQDCFLNDSKNGKPTIIIAHTIKGKGVSIMENNTKWHYRIPNTKEKIVFMDELHISEEEMVVR